MPVRFVFPWALLLLAMVPWSVWVGLQIRSLNRARRTVAISLRAVILTLLVLALAGMEWVRINDHLAVFFLLDHSDSIPTELRQAAAAEVQTLSEQHMTAKDDVGMIVFGGQPSIEFALGPGVGLDDIRSFVPGDQTDLAAAVRLALAAFPDGAMRRMVIMSDGNETRGNALEEVKLARAAGVDVMIAPLRPVTGKEVRIEEVRSPSFVEGGEPFKVRVAVRAEQDSTATLRLSRRDANGKRALPPSEVTLRKGENVFLLPQEVDGSGFFEYEAVVETLDDTIIENNEGRSFTVVRGKPAVLYVEADQENSRYLGAALEQEGLNVSGVSPANMPADLGGLQAFDTVVLSNVSAVDLTSDQINAFEAMVRDLGIGLVMVGGPDTFGAGGFHGTPLERALPVSMDLKQRKVMPRGALVLIMHTCEIPDGNAWAREIGLASLEVLSSHDLMGATGYFYENEKDWVFELQRVGDKTMMRNALMRANPGDMPQMGPSLQRAYNALANADAAAKRIVMISDGDPAAPPGAILKACVDAGISVSTVCIAPHSMNDQTMLQKVAQATGGEYYFVTNARNLPQIFAKEASVVKRGLLIEETFTPAVKHDSELLLAGEAGYPPLNGYVATTPKEGATLPLVTHEDDPLLAHWRFGLGKAVAYTSDVTNRWAADWVQWSNFSAFWAQTVRWAMRDLVRSDFQVETIARDGKGHVKIDAVNAEGAFVNFLRPRGVVTGPGPDFTRQEITLDQTGPGIYEGDFPLDSAGVYMMNLLYDLPDGEQGSLPAGLALNYSREYARTDVNQPMLERLAAAGGGGMLTADVNPFAHTQEPARDITPIWMWLVAIAACLLPLEVFTRRVVVDFLALGRGALAVVRAVPGIGRFVAPPKKGPSRETGSYGGMPARTVQYEPGNAKDILTPGATPETTGEMPVPTETPTPEERPGSSDYTRRLLEAKERALDKKKRRDVGDNDQEI